MAYITNADLEERLGHTMYVQLTDDAGTGLPDEDKVTEARLTAEGEMDSYLGRRHAVPIDLAACPEAAGILKGIALDLASYRLYTRRPPAPEDVASKYNAALRWLQQIAAGQAVLPAATELPANPAAGLVAGLTGNPRILTPDEMEEL